jgi:hypothetical protein
MASKDEETPRRTPGTKIIHAGLFRTATMSMATAYRQLGYTVHHGLDDVSVGGNPWTLIEDASHATWPDLLGSLPSSSPLPRPRPVPYTREDWDRLWGDKYDVATDLASPFAEAMIAAYPEAKVVIVQRDFDPWWASFKPECLDNVFKYPEWSIRWLTWRVMGTRAAYGSAALFRGLMGTMDAHAVTKEQARAVYEGYYSRIRAAVPEDRRLEYTLGDGWGPLCGFLGKEVPRGENGAEEEEVPFPWVNDAEEHRRFTAAQIKEMNRALAAAVMPWFVGAVVAGVGVGAWWARSKGMF